MSSTSERKQESTKKNPRLSDRKPSFIRVLVSCRLQIRSLVLPEPWSLKLVPAFRPLPPLASQITFNLHIDCSSFQVFFFFLFDIFLAFCWFFCFVRSRFDAIPSGHFRICPLSWPRRMVCCIFSPSPVLIFLTRHTHSPHSQLDPIALI